jgi:drug/metabolite transporter (DMT)-like permease
VVVNIQVLLVPLIVLGFLHERLTRRFLIAVVPVLVGVATTAGLGSGASGSAPGLGVLHSVLATLCYSVYLVLLRRSSADGRLAATLLDATIGAAAVSFVAGALWQRVDFHPGWPALGWLVALALSGQVAGGILITIASPRLSSRAGASLLLVQPVGAVLLGFLILHEVPLTHSADRMCAGPRGWLLASSGSPPRAIRGSEPAVNTDTPGIDGH